MSFFWGLNGFFSSAGFPLCGKSLIFWFSNKERASKWAWWSTSHEFGSSAALLLAAPIITAYGWKAAFYVPAVISVLASIIALFTLRDKPASIGLPDIEEYHNTKKPEERLHALPPGSRASWS
jgi:sugar phosphate permease